MAVEWVVGCSVRLLTTLDEVVDGTVFAFDRLSNCVTLSQPGAAPETLDFRIVKASCIKSVLSARLAETPFNFALPSLHLTDDTEPDRPLCANAMCFSLTSRALFL